MAVSDPISDMLTQIRNALMRRRESVELPHSKLREELAKILVREGYLASSRNFKESGRPGKMLHLALKYENGEPAICEIRSISKRGRRVYVRKNGIARRFRGITIVSTGKGLMTNREARKRGLGGELICEVM